MVTYSFYTLEILGGWERMEGGIEYLKYTSQDYSISNDYLKAVIRILVLERFLRVRILSNRIMNSHV
jgi:hypothetical protein